MPALHPNLRNKLERTVVKARDEAEAAARAALERLAVDGPKPFEHLSDEQRLLRRKLRAHARQVGDTLRKNDSHEITHLVGECAYEHWHRMLFARFLAENSLLMHPEGVAVTLEECDELAAEKGTDRWTLAAEYASRMLPQIFRPDDPLLAVTLAPEDKRTLEKLVADLPVEVFTADDSLGWCYQFWQICRKDEIDASGVKIGADEISAVTQLFTEDYMVRFLLHNSLGAWWAGKQQPSGADEAQLRKSLSDTLEDYEFDYLRFIEEEGAWRPASGTFDGWPTEATDLKILDPCCGSGHFLVAVFELMARIRMTEERLSREDAADSVIHDNLFGLEIDARCTQLAAFSVALAAWRFCGAYRPLPPMNIACSGLAPHTPKEQWLELAGDNERLSNGLETLYNLFQQAPTLGSLIDPSRSVADGTLFTATFSELRPLLAKAFQDPSDGGGYGDGLEGFGDGSGYGDGQGGAESAFDPANLDHREMGITARGIADAARLLAGEYHLVCTNVPYLARGKQADELKDYLHTHHGNSKHDLATAFIERCVSFCSSGGSTALVSPQNWMFLSSYKKLRKGLLENQQWDLVARLGFAAFSVMDWWAFNTVLFILSHSSKKNDDSYVMAGVEASENKGPTEKIQQLRESSISLVSQSGQLNNPDCRVTMEERSDLPLLSDIAQSFQGVKTGDDALFRRFHWEIGKIGSRWHFFRSTVDSTVFHGGMESVIDWADDGQGIARRQGMGAWHRHGVAVRLMRHLPCAMYLGERFDSNLSPIVPNTEHDLMPIWAFCASEQFLDAVRVIDQKLNVTEGTLVKVPFDVEHWRKVAAEEYPDGLPKPHSDDPTQWIFHGRPELSETKADAISAPLQVAVTRLLGYCWPAEFDDEMELSDEARALVLRCDELLDLVDDDGIVGIPPVRGELPAADRVRKMLARAYGDAWSPAKEGELVAESGFKNKTLDRWLRDGFFKQHCKLFQNRPFIWHIWDGHKSGFQALVNYHRLADGEQGYKLLETLAFTYLGDWIRQLEKARGSDGTAETRLIHARVLQENLHQILDGESPHDIFVRWKPLEKQPIGWRPDLNDGVRMNIRPFMTVEQPGGKNGAGILREKPNINWSKDRGKDVESAPWYHLGPQYDGNPGDRINDHHLTLEEKKKARIE
ncbi:MAG: Eco57I restriction-modification methylase domain-containing protein [Thermoguttaceae bacterium]